MKTVVINTSKEAKNTKLDILFRAPFDRDSLLWFDSTLEALKNDAERIVQSLIRDVDTVDKDYQLIILVDLYAFPKGNDVQVTRVHQTLITRYIQATLLDELYDMRNLPPVEAAIYYIDSAKYERMLDLNALADNPEEQKKQEESAIKTALKNQKKAIAHTGGDLDDEGVNAPERKSKIRDAEEKILMELFGWTEKTTKKDISWLLPISVDPPVSLDFSEIVKETAFSIQKGSAKTETVDIALKGIREPMESTRFVSVGRFPVYHIVCFVNRENEQSMIEGFFCLFANIFTCIQEKKLQKELLAFRKDQIRELLVDALKKYNYFSQEEHISVKYEPLEKVFRQRNGIYERCKKDAKKNSQFQEMSDEEVAQKVMSEVGRAATRQNDQKLRGLDKTFYNILADIMDHYDPELIREQNNYIVQSSLEGLWHWRDKQNRASFISTVNGAMQTTTVTEEERHKRDKLSFLAQEHQQEMAQLVNDVTDAEHKLAGSKNKLVDAQKLMTQYGDWMRKGKLYLVSLIGAIFTILATVFPFFYTEYTAGVSGLGFQVNLLTLIGFCSFLYAVAATIYITYINRKKVDLIHQLETLRTESLEERKKSIAALYRYYNNTILEAECAQLLWQELVRRDRENARKGIKRNYHIRRLKMLSEEVKRFITLLKLDVNPDTVRVSRADQDEYKKKGLKLRCEYTCYEQENRRVYCFLPEDYGLESKKEKGGTEEA